MKTDRLIYITTILVATIFSSVDICAQQVVVPEGYEQVDSVIYRQAATVDSLLVGKDVFEVLPSRQKGDKGDVTVNQSELLESSMRAHVESNKSRATSGYRIRIYFDNKQTARVESEEAMKKFISLFPAVPIYRTYVNPYFKVTIGDFRTKSEAMELLSKVRRSFSSAFVIRENISYPVVDKDKAVITDTVKVLRPVKMEL